MPTDRARAVARAASLQTLHGLVKAVNGDLDLDRTLLTVCQGLIQGLGFGVAVVNLVMTDGDLEVMVCEGDPGAREALLGQRATRQMWDTWMGGCEPVGELLVDYRHLQDASVPTWLPDLPVPERAGAWDPRDALLAPLRTPRSGLLGVISVDLPVDGLRPGPAALELLEMYAAQASVAVENAQLHSTLRAQNRVRERALARLTAVVDSVPVAIIELDLDGRVRLWNDAAEQIFGWTQQEVLGGRNPVAPAASYDSWLEELRAGHGLRRTQNSRLCRDGRSVEVEMTTSALFDDVGQPYGYLGVYVDVSHRVHLEQELRTAAYTDPLTGLANRAAFTARLAAAENASVVLLDLDGFKAVNDTHGHAAGDLVLIEVARRLSTVCRADDLIARLGGDEFVVLLTAAPAPPAAADRARAVPGEREDPADDPAAESAQPGRLVAETLAGRLVEVLAVPFNVAGRPVSLGASVGLAFAAPPGHQKPSRQEAVGPVTADAAQPGHVLSGRPSGGLDDGSTDPDGLDVGQVLLRDADIAMYVAKTSGKGRVQVYQPAMRDRVVQSAGLRVSPAWWKWPNACLGWLGAHTTPGTHVAS